jgi:hypothetical protein
LWQPLSGLFKHGLIGIINRLAGLALNTAKTALVIALVFFLLFPLLKGLAALNVTAAAAICAYVSESRLFAWLYNNIPRIG